MRALDAIPSSTWQAVQGVLFDIDDTFTRHHALTPDAYRRLCMLQEAGLRLVAVTGRPLGWAQAWAWQWPIDAAVGENGAGWAWREGRKLSMRFYDPPEQREQARRALTKLRGEVQTRFPHITEAADQPARLCDVAFDVAENARVHQDEVDGLKQLVAEHGAGFTVSSVHLHAFIGDWDKAKGLERALRDVLGFELDEQGSQWVFLGDSSNDETAFARFGLSIGVANVEDHLSTMQHRPRYVTQARSDQGFIEVADCLLASR